MWDSNLFLNLWQLWTPCLILLQSYVWAWNEFFYNRIGHRIDAKMFRMTQLRRRSVPGIHQQVVVVVFFSTGKKKLKTFTNILTSIQSVMNWTYNNKGTTFVLNSTTDIWTFDFAMFLAVLSDKLPAFSGSPLLLTWKRFFQMYTD